MDEMTWEETVPAHYFVAETFLDRQMEEHGVRHLGFYAALDVLIDEEAASVKIQEIEDKAMRFEVKYIPYFSNLPGVVKTLSTHGYNEFGRTTHLGHGRAIVHFNTSQGKAYVDIRPQRIDDDDGEDRVFYDGEEDMPSHILVAEGYLEQEIRKHDIDDQCMYGFLQGIGMFCRPRELYLRRLHNGRTRMAELTAQLNEQYIPEEVVHYLSEMGFRPEKAVDIDASGNASTNYRLDDDSIASVFMSSNEQ